MTGLAKGVHFQIYREATGYQEHRAAFLRSATALGGVGIIEHGSKRRGELTADAYRKLRDETRKAGYQSGVAVGPGDFGTEASAAKYARTVAAIAKHADYLVCDLEGKHEDDKFDVDKGLAFFAELRAKLPDTFIVDQPPARPIPRKHGSPLWRLVAQYTDLRAPMLYFNNLRTTLGDDAYRRIWPDYLHDWNEWVPKNTPAPVVADPWIPTIQGYHFVPWTLVDVLVNNPTVLMWCENHACTTDGERSVGPYPTEQTRRGLRAVQRLAQLGFTGTTAVADFQREHGLPIDNVCNAATFVALGF